MANTRQAHGTAQRRVPHNAEAEESALGAALLDPAALAAVVTDLDAEDFYSPAHAAVWSALRSLWEAGITSVDPVIVADELQAMNQLEMVGGPALLISLQAGCPSTQSVGRYIDLVLDYSTRRRLLVASAEVTERVYNDTTMDVSLLVDWAGNRIGEVGVPMTRGEPSPTYEDVMAVEGDYDWQVKGLLERRDRLIITGGEGGGKSTLIRQMAVCMAAGIHPFTFQPIPPVRVTMVDVENTQRQVKRSLTWLTSIPARQINPDMLRIEVRPEGLDLLARHDVAWLLGRCQANRPEVLITGPLYKLHHDDPNAEEPARKITHLFDMIRERYGCSIILEAHAPKAPSGQVRSLYPAGASLWMRWPEFGYGLRRDAGAEPAEIDGHPARVFVEPWRGARDQREWPTMLLGDGAAKWPWRSVDTITEF